MMQSNDSMTIGEVAARTGVPPKTIRFYEETGIIAHPNRDGTRVTRACYSMHSGLPYRRPA